MLNILHNKIATLEQHSDETKLKRTPKRGIWITLSTNVSQYIRVIRFQKQYRRKKMDIYFVLSPSLLIGSGGRRKRFEFQHCATYLHD